MRLFHPPAPPRGGTGVRQDGNNRSLGTALLPCHHVQIDFTAGTVIVEAGYDAHGRTLTVDLTVDLTVQPTATMSIEYD